MGVLLAATPSHREAFQKYEEAVRRRSLAIVTMQHIYYITIIRQKGACMAIQVKCLTVNRYAHNGYFQICLFIASMS